MRGGGRREAAVRLRERKREREKQGEREREREREVHSGIQQGSAEDVQQLERENETKLCVKLEVC